MTLFRPENCSLYALMNGLKMNGLQNLNLHKNLNIFHSNVNGLETKFDNLHEFLSCSPFNIDFVAITETSQTNNENVIRNVCIDGYDLYSTGSKSAKGRTAIYVTNKFNSFERNDIEII